MVPSQTRARIERRWLGIMVPSQVQSQASKDVIRQSCPEPTNTYPESESRVSTSSSCDLAAVGSVRAMVEFFSWLWLDGWSIKGRWSSVKQLVKITIP